MVGPCNCSTAVSAVVHSDNKYYNVKVTHVSEPEEVNTYSVLIVSSDEVMKGTDLHVESNHVPLHVIIFDNEKQTNWPKQYCNGHIKNP